MKYPFLVAILFLFCRPAIQAQPFQLGTPRLYMLPVDDVFFADSTHINMVFDLPGATIHYTLDGSLPDGHSPVCRRSFRLKNSAVVTAVAMHPDYITSEPVRMEVIKISSQYVPVSVGLMSRPSEKYGGLSSISLVDGEKGDPANLHQHWLGFEGTSCIAEFRYQDAVSPDSVMVSTLMNTGSWIFPPRRLEIWQWSEQKDTFLIVTEKDFSDISVSASAGSQILFLKNNPVKSKRWRVVVLPYGPIPDWHPGKGNPAWLFVDEIRMN